MKILKNLLLILLSVLTVGYFIPTTIAGIRKRTNTASIFVLNLFLGWTIIGWVVALTWSVAEEKDSIK
jgi:hypothetical protein